MSNNEFPQTRPLTPWEMFRLYSHYDAHGTVPGLKAVTNQNKAAPSATPKPGIKA